MHKFSQTRSELEQYLRDNFEGYPIAKSSDPAPVWLAINFLCCEIDKLKNKPKLEDDLYG